MKIAKITLIGLLFAAALFMTGCAESLKLIEVALDVAAVVAEVAEEAVEAAE